MGEPFLQENASRNSGILETTLFTRYLGMVCGLVRTMVRMSSGRYCPHHELAYDMKNFCRRVQPSGSLASIDLPCDWSLSVTAMKASRRPPLSAVSSP